MGALGTHRAPSEAETSLPSDRVRPIELHFTRRPCRPHAPFRKIAANP